MTIVQLNLSHGQLMHLSMEIPRGGGGECGQEGDLMAETIPRVGLFIVRNDPRVGTFDFDRPKPGI